ncbi:DnaA N-terminal domain-containing protein [Schinkia sp. CFF1]
MEYSRAKRTVIHFPQPSSEDQTNKDLQYIWTQVLHHLEKNLSRPSFETWLKHTVLIDADEWKREVIVAAPNEFARDWLESRYTKLIKEALYYVTNHFYRVTFVERKEMQHLSPST